MHGFSLAITAYAAAARTASDFRRIAYLFAISVFFLAVGADAQAQSYRFSTVAVEGNQNIDADTVAGFARIARNRSISAAELNAAYQRVASTGFFRSVDFVPSGNRLVIRVQEYPIINRVNLEGNRRINDDVLLPVIQSRSGAVYSPAQAEADATAMAEVYAAQGRLAARITPRLIERGSGRVDLAFEIVEGRMVELQRISFVGNRSYSDRRLRSAIESAQAGLASPFFRVDNYNEQRIARDRELLQDFYRARGFVDAQVLSAVTELARERDGAFVTFTIREGQRYRFGQIDVISDIAGIDPAPYRSAIRVRSGSLFTPQQLENLIQSMERVAQQDGHRFVRAEPRLQRNERDQVIDVTLALVRGDRVFIERIDIQGNATTRDNVIRREFHVAEGDPLNPREIREAAARIRALGHFSEVAETIRPGSASDQAVVDVQLEETTTGSLGFGLSYGRADGIGGNVSYAENNFLGRGQQVRVTFSTVRTSRSLDMSFTEPAVFDRDLAFGLQLGYTQSTPGSYERFGTRVLQFSPSLTFPISRYGRLSVRASLLRDEMRFGDPAALTPPLADRMFQNAAVNDSGTFLTSSVGATYTFDTRRRGPDPDRGFFLSFSPDVAGLGGDRRWLRLTGMVGYEQRILNGDVLLRAEAEAGMISHRSGPSRVIERFNLDNEQFRGFQPYGMGPRGFSIDPNTGERIYSDGLGGNYFAVARLEAQFPLGLPAEYGVSGGVFVDVGRLWGVDNAAGFNVEDSRSIRATAGVALFWDSPFGPLRFNFTTPLRREDYDRPQRFDLSIATRF
ncbi:MAG: outer membrane protein assembly factor BamA [Pararhodobacter sp.]